MAYCIIVLIHSTTFAYIVCRIWIRVDDYLFREVVLEMFTIKISVVCFIAGDASAKVNESPKSSFYSHICLHGRSDTNTICLHGRSDTNTICLHGRSDTNTIQIYAHGES